MIAIPNAPSVYSSGSLLVRHIAVSCRSSGGALTFGRASNRILRRLCYWTIPTCRFQAKSTRCVWCILLSGLRFFVSGAGSARTESEEKVILVSENDLFFTLFFVSVHVPATSVVLYQTWVRSLATFVTHWLLFSRRNWCDPGVWRCQLKTCWGCYCC